MEGMRGIAVLLVFFVHFHALFSGYLNPGTRLFEASHFLGMVGNAGVDLFFVLSGYLIYGALLRRQPRYLKFIWRRAERIYPTFLCVLCLYLIASASRPQISKVHGTAAFDAAEIAANVLLLPGIFHINAIVTVAWSLSYEFFFYLTIPLVVLVTRMAGWRRTWRILFFVGIWVCYLSYSFTVPTSNVRLLMFISGIMLYEVISSGSWKPFLKSETAEILSAVVFGSSLIFIYLLDVHRLSSILPGADLGNTLLPGVVSWEGPYKVIALSLSCFLFTLFCIAGRGPLARAFSWTPLRYLGNMSYSFYLLHGAALHVLAYPLYRVLKPGGNAPVIFCLLFPVSFLGSWIASTALFALVEKPASLRTWSQVRSIRRQKPVAETKVLGVAAALAVVEQKEAESK